MKSNIEYIEDIEAAGAVFCSKSTTRRAKIAVTTLKKRVCKYYANNSLTKEEAETVLTWLSNVEKWLL